MNKILRYISTLILLVFLPGNVFSADEICWGQEGYDLYECRVENICKEYESPKPVYSSQDFQPAENATPEFQNQKVSAPALDTAKKTYRENMGNIYKCGIIQSQRNSLKKLLKFIKQESTGELSDAIGGKVDQRINRLELQSNAIWCALTDSKTEQNKLNILKETTYQMCKYTSYLEYIKSYYEKIWNDYKRTNPTDSQLNSWWYDDATLAQLTKTTPREVSNYINQTKNGIAVEISHTYKVFPLAYHAYSEYENNFPIHFLLEVVEGDFLILRSTLHKTIMPIAQLGLKVINAMSY